MNPFTKLSEVTYDANPKTVAESHKKLAPKGDPKRVMSRTQLKKFAACPKRWLNEPEEESSKAMDFGSMVDCRITTPNFYDTMFVVYPETYPAAKGEEKPWSLNANYCKEWRDAREADGLICVKKAEADAADEAVKSFYADKRLAEFAQISKKQAYVTVEYADPETGLKIPVAILVDFVADPKDARYGTCLGDLKSCDDAHPRVWPRQVFNMGYHLQAALYLDAFNAATGSNYLQFCHLIVESNAPYVTARRVMSAEYIDLGRSQYRAALARYCRCLRDNFWPSHDDEGDVIDGWRVCDVEPWMVLK